MTDDRDARAEADALAERAAAKLRTGSFGDAAVDLEASAAAHQAAGRAGEAARCLHLAATCLRAAGRLDDAAERARRARALAPDGTPMRVSAEAELGEIATQRRRWRDADTAYRAALAHGRQAGLAPLAQAALLRRIAQACAFDDRAEEAAAASREAGELYDRIGRPADARVARVQAASALTAAGLAGPAVAALADARVSAEASDDQAVLADVALLESAQALAAGDAVDALARARAARQHALDGDAPLQYLGAAAAIAELLDHAGDRVGAYGSLAVAWVTLGDKLGGAAAGALVRPLLSAMRTRWGVAEFERARDAYTAARRRS